MKQIVLCATQRCGSTMIVEDMRNAGVLGQPREYFLPWKSGEADAPDWKAQWDEIVRKASGGTDVMSVKVMARQLPRVEACLATFVEGAGDGLLPHFFALFKGAAWIHLVRHDAVAQAVSREMARQTGISHATGRAEDEHFAGNLMRGYVPDYNEGTEYLYDRLHRQTAAITLENVLWRRFFADHGITPLQLDYEDMATRSSDEIARLVAGHAGIALPEGQQVQPRRMVKLSNAQNRDWEARFVHDMMARNFMAGKAE